MPYVRKNRARRARKGTKAIKRIYRPRRSMRRKRVNWRRLPIAIPKTHLVKFRYVEQIQIDASGTGVVGVYAFRANDCYDPNQTGIGHQPYGFDNWMAMYDLCHVVGSRIYVRYTPPSTTSVVPGMVGVSCDSKLHSSATFSDTSHYLEAIPGKKKMIGYGATQDVYADRYAQVSASYSPRKIWKVGKLSEYTSDTDYACTAGSSPQNVAFYNIVVTDINGNNPGIMVFTVTIDYVCVLSQRDVFSQS